MALFESYERRIEQINAELEKHGISSIEEAKQICDTLSGECLIEECTENNVLLCYETMAEYKRKGVLI